MRFTSWTSVVAVAALAAGGFAASVTPILLGPALWFNSPGQPICAVVADVTGDGVQDLVVLQNRENVVTIRAGLGYGTFAPATETLTAPVRPQMYASRIRAARLNGDAAEDLVVGRPGSEWTPVVLSVLLSDGSGGFTATAIPAPPHGSFFGGESFDVADWDGDGDVDIVSAEGHALVLRVNDGSGGFGPAQPIQIAPADVLRRPREVLARDFDGDGRVDLVVTGDAVMEPDHLTTPDGTTVLWRQADGSVMAGDRMSNLRGTLASADLDGDGRTDVVSATPNGFISLFRKESSRSFTETRLSAATSSAWIPDVTVADLNGDDRPEIITPLEVFVNTGDGTFGPPITISTDTKHAFATAAGNLDAHPLPDLVFVGVYDGLRSAGDFWNAVEIVPVRPTNGSPSVTSITPSTLLLRGTGDITVTGTGFAPGATVDFGLGVTVNQAVTESPELLRVNVTIAVEAPQGPRTAFVRNPDGGCDSVAVDVLKPDTLNVSLRRARLRPSARPDRSSFTASGSVGFGVLTPDGLFNTLVESAQIRFGDESSPLSVQIPPRDGWRVRRNVATWTSPRGRIGARVKFTVDFRTHTFKAVVDRADFALAGPDLFFEITLGDETGSSVRTWRPARRGLVIP